MRQLSSFDSLCVRQHFGTPMMVFPQPRAFALLAVFVIHHVALVERKEAMATALRDAGVDGKQIHWVERPGDNASQMVEMRRCFFHPTYMSESTVLKHLWVYWQAAHAPSGSVLLLEDDLSVRW